MLETGAMLATIDVVLHVKYNFLSLFNVLFVLFQFLYIDVGVRQEKSEEKPADMITSGKRGQQKIIL